MLLKQEYNNRRPRDTLQPSLFNSSAWHLGAMPFNDSLTLHTQYYVIVLNIEAYRFFVVQRTEMNETTEEFKLILLPLRFQESDQHGFSWQLTKQRQITSEARDGPFAKQLQSEP